MTDAFDEPGQCTSTSEPLPDAAGPPLLDDSDSHLLNDFFSNPDSFDASSSLLYAGGSEKGESAATNSWAYSLPPSFKGASTVVTAPMQNDQPAVEFTPGSSSIQHANISHNPTYSSTTEDVLGAASTLFNSFQSGGPHLLPDAGLSGLGDVPSLGTLSNSNNTTRAYTLATPPQDQRLDHHNAPLFRNSSMTLPTSYSPQLRFLTPGASLSHQSSASQYADFRRYYKFGSDANFSSNGYNLPPRQETEEEITKRLLQDVKAMRELTPSSTQPSSPKLKFITKKPLGTEHSFTANSIEERHEKDNDVAESDGQKKRRKHDRNGSGEECVPKLSVVYHPESKQSSPLKNVKGRKASHEGFPSTTNFTNSTITANIINDTSSSTSPSAKRRKSQASASQKAARENLTEEQKRNNHILSEQKRRNLIKQGFEDLHMLVPELRSGNFSKSNVLVEAATFLENLVKGNEELAAKLESSWNKQ